MPFATTLPHGLLWVWEKKNVNACKSGGSILYISLTWEWDGKRMHTEYDIFFHKNDEQSVTILHIGELRKKLWIHL